MLLDINDERSVLEFLVLEGGALKEKIFESVSFGISRRFHLFLCEGSPF